MTGLNHAVIIIPGLKDQVRWHQILTGWWKNKGLTPIICAINWHDGESFQPKLERLMKKVNILKREFEKVSVVGTSAGGSAAFNLFLSLPKQLTFAVNVGGRLRPGNNKGLQSFEARTRTSVAFKESVLTFAKKERKIPRNLKQRMMTIRPKFGDELVPADTVILQGANNIAIPSFEHMFSIALTLTIFSNPLVSFLFGNLYPPKIDHQESVGNRES